MAKKEEPIVDNEVGKIKVKEKKEQQPTGNETKGNVTKVKAKMKKSAIDLDKETITKVDLNKPPKPEENEVKENNTNNEGVAPKSEDANAPQKQEEVQPETKTQEAPALEEVTNEKVKEKENIKETIAEVEKTGQPLPENIQKLVNFMEETGGDLNDYVKLNQDYSKLDNQDLLYEYYKQTKPHLDN